MASITDTKGTVKKWRVLPAACHAVWRGRTPCAAVTRHFFTTPTKGFATVEFVLWLPFLALIFWSFAHLFYLAHESQRRQILSQYEEKRLLRMREQQSAVLDRPCLVFPEICAERKR